MYSRFKEITSRLGSRIDGGGHELLTVMGLSLVDGVFPVLVLSGALSSPIQAAQIGILVFGGSATAGVVFGEFEGSLKNNLMTITWVSAIVSAIAIAEALAAPMLAQVLAIPRLEIFAALALSIVAIQVSGSSVSRYLPSPVLVIVVGVLVSLQPFGTRGPVGYNPELVMYTLIATGCGGLFAVVLVLVKHLFGDMLNVERLQQGSAVAIGLLVLAILGFLPSVAPLAALGMTGLFAVEI